MAAISRRWNWYTRAREWDIHQDQIAQEAQVRERRRMAERQARMGVMFQAIAEMEMAKLRQKLEKGVIIANDQGQTKVVDYNLKPYEIARLAEVGSLLERQARGEKDDEQVAKIEVVIMPRRPRPQASQDEEPSAQ
jgi:hypothetical protein